MDGPPLAWMREHASALDAAVTGSVQLRVETAGGPCVFNRMLWVTPDGEVGHYDKRHLLRYAREHERYAAGNERLVVEWRGWRINPLVCYDLQIGKATWKEGGGQSGEIPVVGGYVKKTNKKTNEIT